MQAGIRFFKRAGMITLGAVLCVGSALPARGAFTQSGGDDSSAQKPEPSPEANRRLQELRAGGAQANFQTSEVLPSMQMTEYKVGPEDLLDISVFEAPELNRSVRVSSSGHISLPLLGAVQAAGLTARELEFVLQELLRRRFMKNPHVGVFIREMQSHPVSMLGAVAQPGVYQIRGRKSLVEMLAMAGGLSNDAGSRVIVMRAQSQFLAPAPGEIDPLPESSAAALPNTARDTEWDAPNPGEGNFAGLPQDSSLVIPLKELLESNDPRHNIPIYPGDVIKVTRAPIVYVVGEVNKPGGFVLRSNEQISVLQALALAEGLTSTASKGNSVVIRTGADGRRSEIPVDLGRILKRQDSDVYLRPNDIVFVPNSAAKAALLGGVDAVIRTLSGVIIFGSR